MRYLATVRHRTISQGIEYETKDGVWHEELDPGSDRPQTSVEDEE